MEARGLRVIQWPVEAVEVGAAQLLSRQLRGAMVVQGVSEAAVEAEEVSA